MDQESKEKQLKLTPNQARLKAQQFCAYQERAQQEVRNKLYNWGLYTNEVEEVIADLITENFLNEERFAYAFTSGKFNIKAWGKLKIKQHLKQKMVSPRLIKEALENIDNDAYYNKLEGLLEKKAAILKENDPFKRKNKLAQYAAGKGYESDLIFDILNNNNL